MEGDVEGTFHEEGEVVTR